jgi:hypothetical protein
MEEFMVVSEKMEGGEMYGVIKYKEEIRYNAKGEADDEKIELFPDAMGEVGVEVESSYDGHGGSGQEMGDQSGHSASLSWIRCG